MRISLAYSILIASSIQLLASTTNGQTIDKELVTIELQNDNLVAMVKKIEAQSTLRFIYLPEQLSKYGSVTLARGKRTIKETLDLVLAGTGVSYEESGKYVVLKDRTAASSVPLSVERGMMAIRVSGRVMDEDGQALAGVNIMVKNTTRGTTSDADGKYVIDVDGEDDVLVFSFVGFKSFETQVGNRNAIDISMEADAKTLGSVEVVGTNYFSVEKEYSTMNIAKVEAKDINKQPVTSTLMSLQGRMAGVDVSPVMNSGPGGSVQIRVRGQNSLRTGGVQGDGNLPLYVIDGVPVDSRPLQSASSSIYQNGFDPLSAINPANIESIQVLKDAAATAIYGSRGANGVVLITTKNGGKGGNTNFDVSAYSGVGQIANRMDLLNAEQYLSMRREAFRNDGAQPGELDFDLNGAWDTTRTTDWQDKLLDGTAKIFDAQMNFSGGSNSTSFRFGGGYHKESSPFSNDFNFTRGNVNFAVNHTSINKRFNTSASINYGSTESKLFDDGNFVPSAIRLEPVAPALYDENGNLNWQIATVNGAERNTWTNPLSYLKKTNNSTLDNIIGSATVSYELIKDLNLKANLGFTQLNGSENIKNPIGARSPTLITASSKGESTFGTNTRKSWIIEPQLTYTKAFGSTAIDVVAGTTYQQSDYDLEIIKGMGYSSDALLNSIKGATSTVFTSDNSQYKYIAAFGNVKFEHNGKYILNVSGRRDGSSRFGPGHRYGNFGAVGAGWIFSKEGLFANQSLLKFGKLRASYGITGNDQIGDYRYYNTYSITPFQYQGSVSLYPDALFNSNFAWEVTKKLEVGIELGIINNRVSAEISWYRNRSSNQLVNYQTPSTTGFTSIFTNFNATVENTGLEVLLNTVNVQASELRWTTSVNVSFPQNRLVKFPDLETSPYFTQYKVNEPLTIQRLYLFKGIDTTTGNPVFDDKDGNKSIDSRDLVLTKPLKRNYYGGVTNTFTYRNLELSFLFQFASYYASGFNSIAIPGKMGNQSVDVLNRWQSEGDITNIPKFSQLSANSTLYNSFLSLSDYNTREIYYIRLKTLSIGYRLPTSILNHAHMQDLRFFLQGQNILTFTDDVRLDPETGYGLPPLRIVTLGLQFKI